VGEREGKLFLKEKEESTPRSQMKKKKKAETSEGIEKIALTKGKIEKKIKYERRNPKTKRRERSVLPAWNKNAMSMLRMGRMNQKEEEGGAKGNERGNKKLSTFVISQGVKLAQGGGKGEERTSPRQKGAGPKRKAAAWKKYPLRKEGG